MCNNGAVLRHLGAVLCDTIIFLQLQETLQQREQRYEEEISATLVSGCRQVYMSCYIFILLSCALEGLASIASDGSMCRCVCVMNVLVCCLQYLTAHPQLLHPPCISATTPAGGDGVEAGPQRTAGRAEVLSG